MSQNVCAGLCEVDDPGMSGVEIMRFVEVERFSVLTRERESRFDADEKTVLFTRKLGEGIKGRFEGRFGVLVGFESWAIWGEKVIAEGGVVENGEGGEIFFVEAEGFVAFELLVFLPRGRLKKVVHTEIIA